MAESDRFRSIHRLSLATTSTKTPLARNASPPARLTHDDRVSQTVIGEYPGGAICSWRPDRRDFRGAIVDLRRPVRARP